jgi:hypothetical protein
LEGFIEKDGSGDYCLKTVADFKQYRIQSGIEFPVLGDYCTYKLRVDSEYQVLSCEARFNESNISVDHILRDEKKRKSFKSTKVNQEFFAEIGSTYGADSRRKYEQQHYLNMNGFHNKEVHTAMCLFEVGFCSKQIKYVVRSRSCSTFGLPNVFWKNYDKYTSFSQFVDSFRGNHVKLKTVLRTCILSNPPLFLRVHTRPLIFRSLGDIDMRFFESFTSSSFHHSVYLPREFEYAKAAFFTEEQLSELQTQNIMCEESGNFVATTTLLTCIATVKQLCTDKKLQLKNSDTVLQLNSNFRKAHVSYIDKKEIKAIHILVGGEILFQVEGDCSKAYDVQRSDLKSSKRDIFIHNVNCMSSQELAYVFYFVSSNMRARAMFFVTSNDSYETKAWNTLRNIADIPKVNIDAGETIASHIVHVQSLKEVTFTGICLTDMPLDLDDSVQFFKRGDCVYSLQHAIFGRVYKVACGLVTFSGHDYKVPASACLKAHEENGFHLVPSTCETRVKISEALGLVMTDGNRIRLLRKKMLMMSDDVSEMTYVLRNEDAVAKVLSADKEFVALFK